MARVQVPGEILIIMKIERNKEINSIGNEIKTQFWTIENINSESEEELMRVLCWSKNILGNIRSKNGLQSRKVKNKNIFEACIKIYETDISHLYTDTSENRDFYVYAHCDPAMKIAIENNGVTTFAATLGLTHFAFYIGMGQDNRMNDLNRNETHRKYRQKIQKAGNEIKAILIKNGLTRNEALAIESKLIDIFGLIVSGGHLVNLDEGKESLQRKKLYYDELISLGRIKFNEFKPKIDENI